MLASLSTGVATEGMIDRLRGKLLEKRPPALVIDVQGVGYALQAPLSTFYHLPELQAEICLLTHLSIREDTPVLYGFLSVAERQWFRDLIRVNGVGPKLALSILSTLALNTFSQYIQHNDIIRLTRIPGVGKKTAERLVLEMRDRFAVTNAAVTLPVSTVNGVVEESVDVLIALGYKPQEAKRWIEAVYEEGLKSETLIRRALQKAV
jgi:Holliday junction DNA helicase RuvA